MLAIPISTLTSRIIPELRLYEPPKLSRPPNYKEPDSASVYTVASLIERASQTKVSIGERYSFNTYDETIQYAREQERRQVPIIVIFWFDNEHGFEIPENILEDKGKIHELITNTWGKYASYLDSNLSSYLK